MIKQSLFIGAIMLSTSIIAGTDKFVPADNKNLEYSDYAILNCLTVSGKKIARMHRPLSSPGKGYNWDNPGARLRFKTNAKNITIHLIYNDKHISTSARKPIGIYFIDGKSNPKWKFTTKTRKTVRPVEKVDIKMPVSNDKKEHDYEIIMPYGDSVDIAGVSVNKTAKLSKAKPRPKFRCAIYGDSITQGFTAKSIAGTYAFRLAQKKNWQLINLGIGGRGASASDGSIIGKIKYDLLIVLMGVNNWQGGTLPETYKRYMKKFLINFRKQQKDTPIYFITPLWAPPTWQPPRAKFKLEAYRQSLREIVKESNDKKIKIIEGSGLINHDKKYFDRVAVHPNDAGFKMMAERLAEKI